MLESETDNEVMGVDNQTPVTVTPPQFEVNQEVVIRSSRDTRGRITRVRQVESGEWYYEVYFSSTDTRNIRECDLLEWKPSECLGNVDDLLRDLALLKLRRPQSDSLYALYASRTQFEVYQFKPAVKFLGNPDQRMLIADEVGLGKTIEAGIIYLELQARLDLDQVLVVCPSSLKQKWQDEMKSRFDEEFEIMDSKRVDRFLIDYASRGNSMRLRGIVSLETIRIRRIAERFTDVKLDLVVIDEAHHCRNTTTLANAVASTLVENADAALLLTATPLQMGQTDLFNLLNILSPGEFDNFSTFQQRLEPNQYVNRAASILATGDRARALQQLRMVERTPENRRFLGNPYYQEVVKLLGKSFLLEQELITAQRRLLELNTLSSIFTRTRKRDIQEISPIRTAQTLTVNFTDEERFFYNQMVEEARQDFESRHWSGMGSGWVTIMKERQVASCISAVLRRRGREYSIDISDREDEVFEQEFGFGTEEDNTDWEYDPTEPVENGVQSLGDLVTTSLKRIRFKPRQLNYDSKFNVFWEALQQVLLEDPNTKVLVFSFFRDTIDYLKEQLAMNGVSVSAIHGGLKVIERYGIIDEFRENPEIRVLISSDVGSEGLDFQFCDTLFNYDLPWNPMKVEQRIGRIDRFGQKSPRIRIYNLVIEDTVESRMLTRLYDRIEIFKQSIGDIEEILGEQVRALTQVVFSKRLTPKEEEKLAEEAARNILKKKQEMEEFEKNKLQFLGQEAIFNSTIEKTIESGRFVSAVELEALVKGYVKEKCPLSRLVKDKEDETYMLMANEDLVGNIKTYIFGGNKNDASAQQVLKSFLPGSELALTFSSELALQRKLLHFITPRHPLAQLSLQYWEEKSLGVNRFSQLKLRTDDLIPGEYVFFIYSLDSTGIEQDSRLVPVAISRDTNDVYLDLNRQFLRLAQTNSEPAGHNHGLSETNSIKDIEDSAFNYITRERDSLHQQLSTSNEALLNARLTAIEQSNNAKKAHVEGKLRKVTNASIKRMYEGQLRNMEAKYRAKVNEINSHRNVEVTFSLLSRGCVEVVNDN